MRTEENRGEQWRTEENRGEQRRADENRGEQRRNYYKMLEKTKTTLIFVIEFSQI